MRRETVVLSYRPLAIVLAAAVAVLGGSVAKHAWAEEAAVLRPAEALEVLVMARELNRRCGFLPAAGDELGRYAARAEIATAAMDGAEVARLALRRAKAEAGEMACDEDGRAFVSAALDAAREAARRAGVELARGEQPRKKARPSRMRPGQDSSPHQVAADTAGQAAVRSRPIARREIRRSAAAAGARKPARRQLPRQAAGRTTGNGERGLVWRYVRLAGTYYLDLRCRRLPYARAKSLWLKVRRLHYRVLKTAGPAALLAAKRRAQAMAARRSCGSLRLAGR